MNRAASLPLTTIAMLWLAVAVPTDDAVAQQMQQISFKAPVANPKFTQQHVIDIGDVSGHQIRIFEVHRTFLRDPPVINGIKLVEMWIRGLSDYTDMNGPNTNYVIYVMENSDKFFVQVALETQSFTNPDGTRKNRGNSIGTIMGGTGLFAAIRGTTRTSIIFDSDDSLTEGQTTIEYIINR